jgi:hypothetical protein
MDGYQHYIKTDANGIVIKGYTTGFEQPQAGDSLILQDGPRHFQYNLTNEHGQFIYKVVSGAMLARAQSELDAEWAARPAAPPTTEEKVTSLKSDVAKMLLTLAKNNIK